MAQFLKAKKIRYKAHSYSYVAGPNTAITKDTYLDFLKHIAQYPEHASLCIQGVYVAKQENLHHAMGGYAERFNSLSRFSFSLRLG